MPSSEVRYQRGDVYRHYDEDLLRARRSASGSTSSVLSGGQKKKKTDRNSKHFGSATSAENAAIQHRVNLLSVNPSGNNAVLRRSNQKEEYLTKKKVEVKTTKNTERRVQRCIVLEDGRIIEHDDPHIVVDTVEDTQTHEFDHLEDESLARELQASIEKSYQQAGIPIHEASNRHRRRPNESRRKSLGYDKLHRNKNGHGQDSMKSERDMISEDQVVRQDYTEEEATSGGSIVNDTFKRVVNTHDVRENVVRSHAAKDLGMISRKGLRKVLQNKGKVSDYIKYDEETQRQHNHRGKNQDLVRKYETESHKRVIDTEDTHEITRRLKNGQLRSETFRTEKHEVFDDKKAPDDQGPSGSSETELERDDQHFSMNKTRNFTDYYDNRGNLLTNGPSFMSHESKMVTSADKDHAKWTQVDEDHVKQARNSIRKKLRPNLDAERTDALTKRPLDLDKEERTRKKETDKWLERHFGSDWSLASANKFKYLRSKNNEFDSNNVRRTMSFSSIPIQYTNPGEKVSRVIKQTTTTIRPGFDKHVVSSITKSMVPQTNQQKSRSNLEVSRPYHSTLTLATEGQNRPLNQSYSKKCHASTTSLLNETSQLTYRQVPIQKQDLEDLAHWAKVPVEDQPQPHRPRTRVQRLIDEQRSHRSSNNRSSTTMGRSGRQRHSSYFYGEDPRVQSEPPRIDRRHQQQHQENVVQKRATPLYRTELLKTSNTVHAEDTETESMINRRHWRDELSKSYHDISWDPNAGKEMTSTPIIHNMYPKEKTQSYSDLNMQARKPSQLFGWMDEFNLHSFEHHRGSERQDGIRHHTTMGQNGFKSVQRSKSFATASPSDHSSTSEASYNILHGYQRKTKSYKNTKVSSPPRVQETRPADFRPNAEPARSFKVYKPPEEFAGFKSSSKSKIVHEDSKISSSTSKATTKKNKQNKTQMKETADAVYEFEQKIPMQSSILEAQKFKTVIFVSGN